MKQRTLIITTLTVIISSFTSIAQESFLPGKIITKSGEEIKGLLSFEQDFFTPQEFLFKESIDDTPRQLDAQNTSEVRFDNTFFVLKNFDINAPFSANEIFDEQPQLKFNKRTAFVEVLIGGPKSLFSYVDKEGTPTLLIENNGKLSTLIEQEYRLRLENRQIVDRTISLYKGQLLEALSNCENVVKSIKKITYKQSTLIRLIKSYYDCIGNEDKYFETRSKVKSFYITPLFGVVNNQIEFNGDEGRAAVISEFEGNTSLAFGAAAEILLTRKGSASLIVTGLYTSLKTTGNSSTILGTRIRETIAELEFSHIKLQLTPVANFKFKKSSLSIGGGLSWGIGSEKQNLLKNFSIFGNSVVETELDVYTTFNPIEFGVLGVLNYQYNRHSLNLKYEIGDGVNRDVSMSSQTKRLYLLYGFRL